MSTQGNTPIIVSPADWLAARRELLAKEKEYTRMGDELSRQRRELPWEKVEKNYVFEGPGGTLSLADLFGPRSQLFIYHFMLGAGWQEGCKNCSFVADHFDGMAPHLANRDVTLAAVSHAPLAEITAFQRRMGWRFHWYSSQGSDFNFDYQVALRPEERGQETVFYNYRMTRFPREERPGLSVFVKDANGAVYHTYSAYARGLDVLIGTHHVLDLVPKGRDEAGLAYPMAWVRHHDQYSDSYFKEPTPAAKPAGISCCSGQHQG